MKYRRVARGANLAALQSRGVALREGERTFAGRVRASDRAADLGAQDVVFVTTKATALAALETRRAVEHAETAFVFVQNGIPWWYALGLSKSRPVRRICRAWIPAACLRARWRRSA